MQTFLCGFCNNDISYKNPNRRKFCNSDCYINFLKNNGLKQREERKCIFCDDIFLTIHSNPKKYCSHSCCAKDNNTKHSIETKEKIKNTMKIKYKNGEIILPWFRKTSLKIEKICPICNIKYYIKDWQYKRGHKKFCSAECARKRLGQGGYKPGSVKNYKSGWYESKIAGKIWLDSSYEFIIANYLDSKKYKWKKNYQGFPYINIKNEQHNYIPDFYIEDLDLWVEAKGYMTINDNCKLSYFPYKLKLIGKKEIFEQDKWGF